MTIVSGLLSISEVFNPKKAFGILRCQLGSFVVRNPALANYDEGDYEGFFEINTIKLVCKKIREKYVFQMEAVLLLMAFPDNKKSCAMQIEATDAVPIEPVVQVEDLSDDDKVLFGSLWPLGDKVQIDMTQNRKVIDQQAKRLSAMGYVFILSKQIWEKV